MEMRENEGRPRRVAGEKRGQRARDFPQGEGRLGRGDWKAAD